MAMIKEIEFGPVFTDIQASSLNAFAQVGDTWYFGYVNTGHNGVVYQTSDQGRSWSLYNNYGNQDFVSVTATYAGDEVVVTVGGKQLNQTLVYKNNAIVMEVDGTVPSRGAVCYWPYLAFMDNYSSLGYLQQGTRTPIFSGALNIYGVVGYSPNGDGIDMGGELSGWGYFSANRYTGFALQLSNPSDPHSQVYLRTELSQFGGYYGWLAASSHTYSGFLNFPDFSGFSTGGVSLLIVPNSYVVEYARGTYFAGYAVTGNTSDGYSATGRTAIIADRGLSGPHQTVTGGLVNGIPVACWIDGGGLIGTTADLGVATTTDSAGIQSPFSKAKIYGNQPGVTWSSLSYTPAVQDTSMTAFFMGKRSTDVAFTLYRVHDPDVLAQPHAKNTELYSQTTKITQGRSTIVDPFDPTTQSSATGTIRTDATGPSYGIDLLIQACNDTSLLANPNKSPGCSPILRELMTESGVAYSITREMANDGDQAGHAGGNAIDLAGPSTPSVAADTPVSDIAYSEMSEITALLRQIPSLFATVIHYDPITPESSLFIWDGKLVTAAHYGGPDAQIVKDSMNNIHVSSSTTRLLRGFQDPTVVAALGLSGAYTDPTTGNTTGAGTTDPFTTDRFVYVNGDGYQTSETVGLAAQKQPAMVINFW